jgi:hypothetical protein
MTVKLSILKSGEKIVSDIKEAIVDEKPISYIFENPCLVAIENRQYQISDSTEENYETKVGVSLYPWPTLSKDKVVPIPLDWVVTIVEPNDELKEMYEQDVLNNGNQKLETIDASEQIASSDSD